MANRTCFPTNKIPFSQPSPSARRSRARALSAGQSRPERRRRRGSIGRALGIWPEGPRAGERASELGSLVRQRLSRARLAGPHWTLQANTDLLARYCLERKQKMVSSQRSIRCVCSCVTKQFLHLFASFLHVHSERGNDCLSRIAVPPLSLRPQGESGEARGGSTKWGKNAAVRSAL